MQRYRRVSCRSREPRLATSESCPRIADIGTPVAPSFTDGIAPSQPMSTDRNYAWITRFEASAVHTSEPFLSPPTIRLRRIGTYVASSNGRG